VYFISSILSALGVLLFVFFAYSHLNYLKSNRFAIVFEQEIAVKAAPTASAETNFELHEGAKVKLIENLDDWYKIKLADGKIGWMPSNALKEIN